MKAIALDDEPIALEIIKAHAQKVDAIQLVELFTNAWEALAYLQENEVDLLFLDIKMPDMSGIDFVESLTYRPMVIFTTAYSTYAVTGFELEAVDFLLKPFSLPRFKKACARAQELNKAKAGSTHTTSLFLKSGYDHIKINLEDLIYLEATGNYVGYILGNGEKVVCRTTLGDAIQQLPKEHFLQIHRSFAIAVNRIDKIERSQVILNGTAIPIGEVYRKGLMESMETQLK